MPDSSKGEPFDINRALAPVRVCTPDLGTLALDIRTTSFLSWLEVGEKAGSWTSGPAFVRDFLKERAVRHKIEDSSHGPAPVPARVVDELDQPALDRTAAVIVEVAAPYLLILDPETDDPLLGCDHSDVTSGQAVDIDEPTAALLALALRYLAADRERRRAFVARLQESDGQIGRALGLAAAQYDFPRKFGTIGPVFGSGAELHRLIELAQSPIAKMVREMASNDILSRAAAASKLLPYADRQMTGLTQGLMLNSWLANNSVMSLTRGARLDWVRSLNQTLGLGIQGGIAAAISKLAIDTRLTTEAAFAAAAIMRPGFQTVGTLALAGSVARGLAADVLRSYDLADVDAGELFTSVVSCVTLLDDDQATTAQRADALHRFMDLLGKFGGYVGDQVQQAGLIAIISLLLSIAAIYPDYRALYDSSDPKPSPELVETKARLKALAGQMESDRDRMASQRSRIRYVHMPSPLRVGPDRAAMRMRTVFPDQLVEVRDESGSWAKVAVFDYRSDQEAIGWMSRRNLHVNPN